MAQIYQLRATMLRSRELLLLDFIDNRELWVFRYPTPMCKIKVAKYKINIKIQN